MESFKAFQNWASESEKKVTVQKERYEWPVNLPCVITINIFSAFADAQ